MFRKDKRRKIFRKPVIYSYHEIMKVIAPRRMEVIRLVMEADPLKRVTNHYAAHTHLAKRIH